MRTSHDNFIGSLAGNELEALTIGLNLGIALTPLPGAKVIKAINNSKGTYRL